MPVSAAVVTSGELFVDLRASDLSPGTAPAAWTNHGTIGDFQRVNDPAYAPVVETVSGAAAVTFNATGTDDYFRSPVNAPVGLTGVNPTATIEAWVYNPAIPAEETVVAWGTRGGPAGTNMSFNYGNHQLYGAVGHWADADIGWNNAGGAPAAGQWHHLVYTYDGAITRVYADGQLANSEDDVALGGLNTHAAFPISLPQQNTSAYDGNPLSATGMEFGLAGTLSIGQMRIHDGVLSGEQVFNNFAVEAASYGISAPSMIPPAAMIHRYSFSETGGTQLTDSIGGAHGTIVDVGANDATLTGGLLTLTGGAKDASDYGDLPDGLISGLTDATIEIWAAQNAVQNWARIFDFGSATNDYLMMSWTRGTTLANDRVEFNSTDDGGVNSTLNESMQPYTLGQQFHIVMTIDQGGGVGGATRIRVYKDGALRGVLDTPNTLSDINDVEMMIGRSFWPDNTASASYDELRIYDTALSQNQILFSRNQGAYAVSALPEARLDIGDWNFRYHDAGGNTQGTEVLDGESVGDGDLWNSSPVAPPESDGHNVTGGPVYRTYNVAAEGLTGKPGADGFALDTSGDGAGTGGYPYFSDNNSLLQLDLATNKEFSAWARVQRTADAPAGAGATDNFEAILSRPYGWRLGIDDDGTIVAEFGNPGVDSVVLDTQIPFEVGDWHEIGFTYDGTGIGDGTVTVYVDGQAAGSYTPPAFNAGDVFHIGNGPGNAWDFYGLVDRVQFWQEAVDPAVMQALSVPEPSSLILIGTALLALAMVLRRRG